ncbi:hypothetical protein DPN68_05460 [Flavobacterium tibetense]|uniref:Uncharacterized protein n=1 Tax=Flavobacterium tibetense TaxID=2233533 RepID=A0A365P2U7_9FLAO|nr:hypothetical protein DPN68_05460 [Flavobacterium tibetense]
MALLKDQLIEITIKLQNKLLQVKDMQVNLEVCKMILDTSPMLIITPLKVTLLLPFMTATTTKTPIIMRVGETMLAM